MKKVTVKLDIKDQKQEEEEPAPECLQCWYFCKTEEKLDTHMETIHQKEL